MNHLNETEEEAYNTFLDKKLDDLGQYPGQFYPYQLENLFADECEKIAQGLIFNKFNSDQAAAMLIGIYKGYKKLKNDLN